jgi:hypothetical protein
VIAGIGIEISRFKLMFGWRILSKHGSGRAGVRVSPPRETIAEIATGAG